MLTPGDEAKIGGSPITGVAGPSGWVRSTISSRPAARSSTRCVSVVAIGPDYIRSHGALAARARRGFRLPWPERAKRVEGRRTTRAVASAFRRNRGLPQAGGFVRVPPRLGLRPENRSSGAGLTATASAGALRGPVSHQLG